MSDCTIILDPTQQIGLILLGIVFVAYGVYMTCAYIITRKRLKNKLNEKPKIVHEPEIYDGIDDLSIFEVAKYILEVHGRPIKGDRIHKLCYFMQIAFLIRYNKPLFKENFVRWRTGPVCPEFYNFIIDKSFFMFKPENIEQTSDRLTEIQKRIIKEELQEWDKYDTLSISHCANETSVMHNIKLGDTIPNQILIDYYNK